MLKREKVEALKRVEPHAKGAKGAEVSDSFAAVATVA